jgi:hypothetical protein
MTLITVRVKYLNYERDSINNIVPGEIGVNLKVKNITYFLCYDFNVPR